MRDFKGAPPRQAYCPGKVRSCLLSRSERKGRSSSCRTVFHNGGSGGFFVVVVAESWRREKSIFAELKCLVWKRVG